MSAARMLTRTQIENATTEEMERLRVRIEAELEGRRGPRSATMRAIRAQLRY